MRDAVVCAVQVDQTASKLELDDAVAKLATTRGLLRVFSVDLPGSVRAVTVPDEFLEPGTEYSLEVQAIEAGGNQKLTQIAFRVK